MRKPNCKCHICEKEIYRRPSQIKASKVFCSIICTGIDQRKIKKCPVCTKEYTGFKDNFNILHVHHKVEKCNGGSDDIENLNLLCPNCHYTHHHGYGKWRMTEVSIPMPFSTASFQD